MAGIFVFAFFLRLAFLNHLQFFFWGLLLVRHVLTWQQARRTSTFIPTSALVAEICVVDHWWKRQNHKGKSDPSNYFPHACVARTCVAFTQHKRNHPESHCDPRNYSRDASPEDGDRPLAHPRVRLSAHLLASS
jgi:hypothetical protein